MRGGIERPNPNSLAGAKEYADKYWMFGSEPATQLALMILSRHVAAQSKLIERYENGGLS